MSEPKKRMMTVGDVRKRVAALAEKCGDAEIAHSIEDGIHQDVLRAIADGECEDPAACARVALETDDLGFSRWYA